MGLSRNKVAVPEGVAGTPPFWSVSEARRPSEVGAREYFPISLFCILRRAQPRSARTLEVQFIDNTERKDQRGKEKQKESLYNLEFRSFFELRI